MRDVNSRYALLCQSLGIQGWRRLKVVELRALKRPLARRRPSLVCSPLVTLVWWRSLAMKISARCHTGCISRRLLPQPEGAVTALLLLLLCFALFTVIEKLPGRNVKTD